jgi:hypothetical protein
MATPPEANIEVQETANNSYPDALDPPAMCSDTYFRLITWFRPNGVDQCSTGLPKASYFAPEDIRQK